MTFGNVKSLLQAFLLHLAFPEGGCCNVNLPGCSFVPYFAFFFALLFRFSFLLLFSIHASFFSRCVHCVCAQYVCLLRKCAPKNVVGRFQNSCCCKALAKFRVLRAGKPIPVAARSVASVCSLSLSGIAGSNS